MKLFLNFILVRKYLKVFFLVTLAALFSEVLGQVEWTKYGGNPVLQAGASGTWDDDGFPSANVLIIGATYYMWYTGNDGKVQASSGLPADGGSATGHHQADSKPDLQQ